jgi:hypothetical protein
MKHPDQVLAKLNDAFQGERFFASPIISIGAELGTDAYLAREGLIPIEQVTSTVSPEITHRKPV